MPRRCSPFCGLLLCTVKYLHEKKPFIEEPSTHLGGPIEIPLLQLPLLTSYNARTTQALDRENLVFALSKLSICVINSTHPVVLFGIRRWAIRLATDI